MIIMTEKHMKRFTLNIDADLHKKVKLIADAKGISANEYINQIVKKEINKTDIVELIKNI